MQFTKKIATLLGLPNKNRQPAAKNQKRSFTSRGATVGLGLRLWLTRLIVLQGRRNLPFFGNLAEKLVVSTIKLFCFAIIYIIHKLFFSNLPQIRITMWYGRIISKMAKIRIGYGQSVPGGKNVGIDLPNFIFSPAVPCTNISNFMERNEKKVLSVISGKYQIPNSCEYTAHDFC